MASVNTNLSALVALRTLTSVQHDLAASQKRVSTGYNVADAFDNGAIFAVAQSIRNSITGVTAVNSQFQGAQGLISVTAASPTHGSELMTHGPGILTPLAGPKISS